jgi:hypothetical protein
VPRRLLPILLLLAILAPSRAHANCPPEESGCTMPGEVVLGTIVGGIASAGSVITAAVDLRAVVVSRHPGGLAVTGGIVLGVVDLVAGGVLISSDFGDEAGYGWVHDAGLAFAVGGVVTVGLALVASRMPRPVQVAPMVALDRAGMPAVGLAVTLTGL